MHWMHCFAERASGLADLKIYLKIYYLATACFNQLRLTLVFAAARENGRLNTRWLERTRSDMLVFATMTFQEWQSSSLHCQDRLQW